MRVVEGQRLPVTHPQWMRAPADQVTGDRHLLGYARTRLGALRILRKVPGGADTTDARIAELIVGPRRHPVWEPR